MYVFSGWSCCQKCSQDSALEGEKTSCSVENIDILYDNSIEDTKNVTEKDLEMSKEHVNKSMDGSIL